MCASGGIFAGVREYTEDRGCCSLLQHSMQIAHAGSNTVLSAGKSKTVMDSHFSSNSIRERRSIIDIPNQHYAPAVLALTRADPNQSRRKALL